MDAGIEGALSSIQEINALPPELEQKIRNEPYRDVAVGACRTSGAAGFNRYRIALVFY